MKIAFLNSYHPDDFSGGAENSMSLQKRLLEKNGHKVLMLTPRWGSGHGTVPFLKMNPPVSPIWIVNPCSILYFVIWIMWLARDCQIIHVQGKFLLPAGLLAGKLLRIPVVVTMRDYQSLCPYGYCLVRSDKACSFKELFTTGMIIYLKQQGISSLLLKAYQVVGTFLGWMRIQLLQFCLSKVDHIVYVSSGIQRIYLKNGVTNKSSVIYNPPPMVKFSPKADLKNQRIRPLVLFAGRLSWGKGIDLFFAAAKQLHKQATFLAIGRETPTTPKIPPEVRYLGSLSYDQTLEYIRKASIVCVPSRWPEPLSRVIIEAMWFSKPVVSTNRGGTPEIVKHESNGLVVEPTAKEISAVLEHLIDRPKKMTELGKAGRKFLVENFDAKLQINNLVSLYNQLVK